MFYEVTEKSPYLSKGERQTDEWTIFLFLLFYISPPPPTLPGPAVYHGNAQQKGMGMVPKRAVEVMSCQIARLLQLTQHSVIPVAYHVQRKVGRGGREKSGRAPV